MIYTFGGVHGTQSQFADKIAEFAVWALMTEVCIGPKPGLVDRTNSGAHADMDLFTFINSASALFPYFRTVTAHSLTYDGDLRALLSCLAPIGIQAEQDMLLATGGVNTHKGAIFSLGVLCAAAASVAKQEEKGAEPDLAEACASIAGGRVRECAAQRDGVTKGEQVYIQHGISGILGEAVAGFPHMFEVALPIFRKQMERGSSVEEAGVAALLHLIAAVDDTNIIARCGIEVLRDTQTRVGKEIAEYRNVSQYMQFARALDKAFIQRNISPGGCADLLAATCFVYRLFYG